MTTRALQHAMALVATLLLPAWSEHAFGQDGAATVPRNQPRPMLIEQTAGLPNSFQLLPLHPHDVAQLVQAFEPRGCGGWVFAASAQNADQPGVPLIALPSGKYGVFRASAGLGPVAGVRSQRADEPQPALLVKGSGFSLGPLVEILSWQEAKELLREEAGWKVAPMLSVVAIDGRIAERRVPCTLGGGACRRYVAAYRGRWVSPESHAQALPVEVSPGRLIVEDRCPWTRSALIEYYASRIQLQEWYYERTNP